MATCPHGRRTCDGYESYATDVRTPTDVFFLNLVGAALIAVIVWREKLYACVVRECKRVQVHCTLSRR